MLGTETTRKWRVLRSLFSVIHKAATRCGGANTGCRTLCSLLIHFRSVFRVIAACIFSWERLPEDNKVWSALMRDWINEEFCWEWKRSRLQVSKFCAKETKFLPISIPRWFLTFLNNHNRSDPLLVLQKDAKRVRTNCIVRMIARLLLQIVIKVQLDWSSSLLKFRSYINGVPS